MLRIVIDIVTGVREGKAMFGLTNRKQEKRDREEELAVCQAALARMEHIFGEMSLIWVNAEQRLSEIEKEQKELERQLKRASQAAGNVSSEAEKQKASNRKLLERAEEIAEKQKVLRTERQEAWEEAGNREAEEPMDLTRVIAPVTMELSRGMEEMRNMLEGVVELGRKMDVVSLNAAVEAGRMGEDGKRIVEAAEDVRELSKQYQQATGTLAQQMQSVGLEWQKSKDEIVEVEQRLKQQYTRLRTARKACEDIGEEILKLPIVELHDEMEKTFGNEAMQERCEDVSEKVEEARQDFARQREIYNSLRKAVSGAKTLIKDI